jgi:hypothetical protein
VNHATPGWFPDPKDPSRVRWFDGRFWTEHDEPASVDLPTGASRRPRTGVLVAGGIAAGVVVLGLLVAAAVPIYHQQRQRVALAPLTALTCDDVAAEAVELARVEKDLDPLAAVTSTTVARDSRTAMRIPAPGAEEFVMSCSGTGTRPDGSSAPLTIELYIDHERTHLLWYTWDV